MYARFTVGLLNLLLFIGPESDHWLCLSLTDSLTNSLTDSYLVNLIDVTLACEDANSKLVDVATVADEDCVGNNFFVDFEAEVWSKKLNFRSYFEHKVWSRF